VVLFLAPVLVLALAACSRGVNTAQSAGQPTGRSARTWPCFPPNQVKSNQILVNGARVVLGVVAVPPPYISQTVKERVGPWRYWSKWGLFIRTGSPPVLVTVPQGWQHRAAINWGNDRGIATSTVRLPSCPWPRGMWDAYAGGFYLRSSAACVPLVFQVLRRTTTVRFGMGRHCGK
jgi:hypothetical protein